jgi:hypothetical protein
MRQALGVAVFSGMLGVTVFGIFLTPVFHYSIRYFQDPRKYHKHHPAGGAGRRGERCLILSANHAGVVTMRRWDFFNLRS